MRLVPPRSLVLAVAVAALPSLPSPALAGGLYLPGTGPTGQARAGAVVARADGPAALAHNPAGLARQRGTTLAVGLSLVDLSLRYQRAGSYEPVADHALPWAGTPYPAVEDRSRPDFGIGGFQALPLLVVASDLGTSRWGFAGGIYVPNAYPQRDFDDGYQFQDPHRPPPPQRYDVVRQRVDAVFPSLAAAYRLTDRLAIGLRVTAGLASVEAESYVWGLGNYSEHTALDGHVELAAEDRFVPSAGLGAHYRPSAWLELGAAVHSPSTIDARGTGRATLGRQLGAAGLQDVIEPVADEQARCAPGGTIDALRACVRLPLPLRAAVGARAIWRDDDGRPRGDLELDVVWERWSAASDFEVIVDGRSSLARLPLQPTTVRHGLRDTLSIRLGGEANVAPRVTVRGGVAYDTAAAPDSWQRLDVDGAARLTLATGLSIELGRFAIDLGGGFVAEPDRMVADACNPTETAIGCLGTGRETPVEERSRPDPIQPLRGPGALIESPFNAGTYESHYVLLSAGLRVRL